MEALLPANDPANEHSDETMATYYIELNVTRTNQAFTGGLAHIDRGAPAPLRIGPAVSRSVFIRIRTRAL